MPLSISYTHWRSSASFLIFLTLAGCSSVPQSRSPVPETSGPRQASLPKSSSSNIPALPPAGSGRGGYYLDDGPGDDIPDGLHEMPDAEPKLEPLGKRGNRPYVVFGKTYTPFTHGRPFSQRGMGSWYGKKFHGQKTSSGELYDMYQMTAAHPTMPLPSYARVTNVANGRQVIVRVNDRGPFHSGRIIDLSYAAAFKLAYLNRGSAELEVERLLPDEIERISSNRQVQTAAMQPAPAAEESLHSPQNGVSAVPVSAAAIASPSAAAPAPGFYIQLGAYSQAGNAEAVRTRLMQKWESNLPPIEVVESGALYRLQSGPFATRAEAAMAALQLENAGTARPVIVQR